MPPRRWLPVLLLSTGCAGLPGKGSPAPPLPAERAAGVVFCADGAGGLSGTTGVFRDAVAEARLPLRVELVEWSHGSCRFLADHAHWRHIERQGEALAGQVR